MLREALPEKDWTPYQREQMGGWNRLWTRDRQWLRIERWKLRQQHTRDWVCLARIADWCARRPGDIERDPRRGTLAYLELQQSIVHGEFSKGGRLKVICLGPQASIVYAVRLRLNASHIEAQPRTIHDHVLDLCWAPRELCLRWLVARQIVPPPWLAAEPIRVEPADAGGASKPGATAYPPSLSFASEDRIHAAIDAVYTASTAKPPNLKEVVPLVRAELLTTNQMALWKEIGRCAKDPRHAGNRRPRGRTLKSEQNRRSDA
jgi:hypothetical protein